MIEPSITDELVEDACEQLHDSYERAAVVHGWDTNPAAKHKPWAEVPESNQATMRDAVRDLLGSLRWLRGAAGLRMLGEQQCCLLACDGGACEACPCCSAGWCVQGTDFPDPGIELGDHTDENWLQWLEVAKEHNPIAAQLAKSVHAGDVVEVMDQEICGCEQCEDGDRYNEGARAVQAAVVKLIDRTTT